ncbi:unnamed protein product [Rotaria sordida]|uniref:Uncharacterized protein n=1 Tax=Rotaria sordida TaxID=392033 RepID=A0A813WUW8_9BILA|nr:unnamed protein product [Rotaria sordida]CAF3843379.1 unnamed protein product [Rotaria sordida]
MGKQDYYRQQSFNDVLDSEQQNDDDDDYLKTFETLLFEELLWPIRKFNFTNIINNNLLYDDAKHYGLIESNSLKWLYTADRKMINNVRIYSFRFANSCNPDYYESFIITNHPFFAPTKQPRHGLEGWYKYTGKELPKTIENYLHVEKIMNEQVSHKTKIFVNNKYERLDIEFYFQHYYPKRLTITFESGYPATP